MSRRPRQLERGAAATETALGLLVLLPVIMYGVHFTEVGIVSMKVTEAAASAMWDTTAWPMHVTGFPGYSGPMRDMSLRSSEFSARLRYGLGFDGRMSALSTDRTGMFSSIPAVRYGQAFTGAGEMNVGCASTTQPGLPGPGLTFRPFFVSRFLPDPGGVACRSQAAAINILPDAFLEGGEGGLFEASMKDGIANRIGIPICGMGRPDGLYGSCSGTMSMMLDDWGLANQAAEADICSVTLFGAPCENINYYLAAKAMYETVTLPMTLGPAAPHRLLLRSVYGTVPLGVNTDTSFYMSFTGEEPRFMTPVIAWDADMMIWQNTPYLWPPPAATYATAHVMRQKCYLGLPGC